MAVQSRLDRVAGVLSAAGMEASADAAMSGILLLDCARLCPSVRVRRLAMLQTWRVEHCKAGYQHVLGEDENLYEALRQALQELRTRETC